jgi:hypothetical protein
MTLAGRLRQLAAELDSWLLSYREVEPATPSVLRQNGESQSHESSARVSLQATELAMNRPLCSNNGSWPSGTKFRGKLSVYKGVISIRLP